MKGFSLPKIGIKTNGHIYVHFTIQGERFRFSNGKVIDSPYEPNKLLGEQRQLSAELLKSDFTSALGRGWKPKRTSNPEKVYSILEALKKSSKEKLSSVESPQHKRDIQWTCKHFTEYLRKCNKHGKPISSLDKKTIEAFLSEATESVATRKLFKKVIQALLTPYLPSSTVDAFRSIKLPKSKSKLHKPIKDVQALLSEVEAFNPHLHLCCLLAYGCLLRPHREIRELTWNDFSDDLSFISLSGSRNKGKRNRIVPIPAFVLPYLKPSHPSHNIFTGTENAYNPDYFKTLWGKFKKKSVLLQREQTLYSFRHTGAINVFKKTGSLQKLQSVMGHSNLQVTLTYLRGLEVPQLSVDDMPEL
jgi:integrase